MSWRYVYHSGAINHGEGVIDTAKRSLWLLGGICTLALSACFYLNYAYYFNPLTFKQSPVTPLPWDWYKNPLQLDYGVLDEDGWKLYSTTDRAEIELVFRELQAGVQGSSADLSPGTNRQIWFGIRRQCDGVILLSVDGQESSAICQVQDSTEIRLSERLQLLLQERLQQARLESSRRGT